MQAYEGYFENGNFYTAGRKISIPELRRTIVILDDEAVETENSSQKQLEAFRRFVEANRILNEKGIEPIDDEFDGILAQGISIRELDL